MQVSGYFFSKKSNLSLEELTNVVCRFLHFFRSHFQLVPLQKRLQVIVVRSFKISCKQFVF